MQPIPGETQPSGEQRPLFFSYSHTDRETAAGIIAALEAAGYVVWWDDHIDAGAAFVRSIEEALEKAGAIIVLWSPTSIQSNWVADEAAQGRDTNRLVPLSVGGARPPLGFRQLHYIELDRWNGKTDAPEMDRVRRAVETCLNIEQGGSTVQAISSAALPRSGVGRRTVLMGIGAGAAALGGAGAFLLRSKPKLAGNGVAVLPFRNLSGDPEQNYLSAGLASEVRSVLARNAALLVVAQASSEAVRERGMSASEMARALAVSYLIDGNVRRVGNNIRIAAELIDGRTGFSSWSETFERPLEELSTIQDAIANAVTAAMSISIRADGPTPSFGDTANAAAFNDYLKGKALYESAVSTETDRAALSAFDQAIARDPAFGAAHAARSRTLTVLGNTSETVTDAQRYYDEALAAAYEAVEKGPASADAHSTLGYVLFQAKLNVSSAKEPYEKSLALGQGDAVVLARYAAYAAATKQFAKAKRAVLRARDLDALNANIHRAVGFVEYASGAYQGAIDAVERALSLNPELSDSYARIGMAHLALGDPKRAIAAAEKERSRLVRYPCLAIAHFRLGNEPAAREAMSALINDYADAGLYQQGQILAQWGRGDEAMKVLGRAYEAGDSGLTYAFIDPTLAPVRDREDFQQLIQRLGFV